MKNIKKVSKYHLSIISLLVICTLLIAGIWIWFEMKNHELEEQLQDNKRALTINK